MTSKNKVEEDPLTKSMNEKELKKEEVKRDKEG
jgi:hypothetical protein